MNFLGINFDVHSIPQIDSGFIPFAAFARAYRAVAAKPFAAAYERADDDISVYEMRIIGTPDSRQADLYYLGRTIVCLERAWGGHTLYLCGDTDLAEAVADQFREGGAFYESPALVRKLYNKDFSIKILPYSERPETNELSLPAGGKTKGYRIGFDAGGSDIKVCAVIDGKPVFGEEREWLAKLKPDISYHFSYIVQALKDAASHLPQVDAIGVSGPGMYTKNNECLGSSIYKSLPADVVKSKGRTLFIDAVKELGPDIPLTALGDGEVAAIAGSMQLGGATRVIGLPLGTNVGGGYVDQNGNLTGLRASLGSLPIDCMPGAPMDEFSKATGCAGIYISQDGVLRMAAAAGIVTKGESLAIRLKEIQGLANAGDAAALSIFRDVGICLGHTLALYDNFFAIDHVVIMGRVCSGRGGETLYAQAKATLAADYPECSFALHMPEETTRRMGQAVAAASL